MLKVNKIINNLINRIRLKRLNKYKKLSIILTQNKQKKQYKIY